MRVRNAAYRYTNIVSRSSRTVPRQTFVILPKSQCLIIAISEGKRVIITENSTQFHPKLMEPLPLMGGGAEAFQFAFSVSMAHRGAAVGTYVACSMLPGAPYLAETAQHEQTLLRIWKEAAVACRCLGRDSNTSLEDNR